MAVVARVCRSRGIVMLTLAAAAVAFPGHAAGQDANGFTNLHVLSPDIPRRALFDVMLENGEGLGLPRRANEGCLFCHTGSMDIPSDEWDWASDANPRKATARSMMAMVAEINDGYLANIERTTEQRVTCYTCHAGRTNPLPLDAVLERAYEEGGIDVLIERYHALRTRYFAADAYDFRPSTLIAVAEGLYEAGHASDAERVHGTNIEASGDPAAHQGLIRMKMVEALDTEGVESMVAVYRSLKSDHPAEAWTPRLLSSTSWGLFRSGQQEAGVRLWELNFEEYPESYTTTEDLAWGRASTGRHDEAIALAEAWVAQHPDHELGLRLLAELRESAR